MKRKHWRMLFVGLGMAALGLCAGLILLALDENLVFFHDPSALRGKSFAADQRRASAASSRRAASSGAPPGCAST